MLVAKNKEMKERVAATKSMNLRQSTMTQEFEAVADRAATVEPLPPGWIRIWDNPGGRHYFFNTVDHDIQKDLIHVHAKVALNAVRLTEEGKKESDNDVPDAVGSASRNAIISPSPVLSRKRKSAPRDAPTTYGGTVDMSFTSSDDDEESGDDADSESETDFESRKKGGTTLTRLYKKHQKVSAKKVPSNETVETIPRVLSQMYDEDETSDVSQSSENVAAENEIDTQDLPNTQDFVGAEALVNLQTEPTTFFEDDGTV
jgi:hypothetical protein